MKFVFDRRMLPPAMMRIFVLLIGLVWASLLLVSWGGHSEAQSNPAPRAASADRAS